MRRITLSLLLIVLPCSVLFGQVRQFPYRASVTSDGVLARSGPGQRKYYATGQMKAGQAVVVHRHDPGGWYMISPPEGSFSWIRADDVQRDTPSQGTVAATVAPVWVGSALGQHHNVQQVQLSRGARVRILGEGNLPVAGGTTRMYRIAPPQGEYRWVAGQSLAPVDAQVQAARDRDPFAVPSSIQPTPVKPQKTVSTSDPNRSQPEVANSQPVSEATVVTRRPSTELDAQRQAIRDLDRRLRATLAGEIATWYLVSLKQEYLKLQSTASHPSIADAVSQRLPVIHRNAAIKAEYDAVQAIRRETEQRDADLIAQYRPNNAVPQNNPAPTTPATPASSQGPMLPTQPPPMNTPNGSQSPQPAPSAAPTPQFDRVGTLQRAQVGPAGQMAYVLVGTNGQPLSWVRPQTGVNLNSYLGQTVGINGQRFRRKDSPLELIVAEKITPVKLSQPSSGPLSTP